MSVLANSTGLFHWLESSEAALFIRQSLWLYPAVEIVHIIGFSILVGSAFLFDLRLLGLARKLPVSDCVRHFIHWARVSFLVVLPSGLTLFMVNATDLAVNPVFRLKLILIVLAGLNAAVFHRFTKKSVKNWNTDKKTPVTAKLAGIFSIILWFSIISCGRMIAYI